MAESKITFKIAADLEKAGFKQAGAHLKKLAAETKKVEEESKKTAKGTDMMKNAYGALMGLGVLAFFKSAVDEAARAEEATNLLGHRVEASGLSWDANKEKIQAYTKSLQEYTRFSQTEIETTLGRMIDMTGSVRTSQEKLNVVLGLSVARNMSLEQSSELVAKATMGNVGAQTQLGEILGLTETQSRKNLLVMGKLEEQFGDLARTEDSAIKKMKQFENQFKEVKKTVGDFFMPAVTEVMGAIIRLGKVLDKIVGAWVAGWLAMWQAVTLKGDLAVESLKLVGKKLREAMTEMTKQPGGEGGMEDLVDQTVKGAQEMSAELLRIQKQLAADGASNEIEAFEARKELLMAQAEFEKDQLMQMQDFRVIAAEEQAELLAAIEKKSQQQILNEAKKGLMARANTALKVGTIIGTATGKMLTGEKDAWKTATIAIIDMIAQKAQAHVMAAAVEGAAEEVARKGLAGLATGLPLLAWGAVQAAGIQALAEVAKSAIQGGGGGAVSSPTAGAAPGIGGGGGGETVATPAPEPKGMTLIIDVKGDILGEPEAMDRLAERIVEGVENRDVRFTATSLAT